MWFGVDKGVIHYNGYDWEEFNADSGFTDAAVTALYLTKKGYLFAGSDSGIFIYKQNRWQIVCPAPFNEKFLITSITGLTNETVLCGTNLGLLWISGEKKIFYISETEEMNSLKNAGYDIRIVPDSVTVADKFFIADVMVDREGKIWLVVGYHDGLYGKIVHIYLSSESTEIVRYLNFYTEQPDIRFFNGAKILQAADGNTWLITNQSDQGHVIFEGDSVQRFSLNQLFGEEDIAHSIIQSRDGTIWIGGFGKLYTYKNGNWKIYRSPEIPIHSSKRILLYEAEDGILWIAGKQNIVYRFDYTINTWATYCGLNFEGETSDGVQWFLTVNNRLVSHQDNNWISYGWEDGSIDAPVRILITTKDEIWAAGSHNGVSATAYFKDGRWFKKLHPKLSWSIDYRSVIEDREGNLWFGATVDIDVSKGQMGGSVFLKDPINNKKDYIHYLTEQKEPSAYGMGQSADGTLWMAGVSACYFKEGRWLNVTYPEVLSYHSDYMCNSKEGVLWIGSRNYGVLSFNGKEWKNYTMDDGLASNSITCIFPESDSCIWVATDKGISKFDGQGWTNNILPAQLNISAEGGSIRKSKGGVIWINKSLREWNRRVHIQKEITAKSFKDFWTVFYKRDKKAPITKVSIFDKKVYQPGNTIISWEGIDPWSITPVEKLQFSYRMDNNPWSAFSYKTNDIFLSLPIGDHTFEVRARDLDFNIDPAPASISFNVAPPFYLQPVFYIPILVLVILIIILQIRIIIRGKKLRMAKRETDNILHNVEEGLALINKEYRIGSQYSLVLESIFEEKILARRSVLEILQGKVPEEIINTTKEYLDIIFSNSHDQKMMDDLNPLSEVKFDFGKGHDPKYLAFKFRKIYSLNGKHKELIVTIRDITSKILLEQQLKESQEEAKRKMDWLVSILHIDPPLLKDFLTSSNDEIQIVEKLISDVTTVKNHKNIMEKIYRSMHLIKGNASLLSLNTFAEQTHEFEDKISVLQKKRTLNFNDLNILNDGLVNMKKTLDEVNSLLERIGEIHQQMRPKRSYEFKEMIQAFKNLIKQLSEKDNKKIDLKYDNFRIEDIPYKDQLFIKDIIVQLIRNSVVHGVESIEERRAKHKPIPATIELTTHSDDIHYQLKIRDDGRGIQLQKLKERAIESGKWTRKEIERWDRDTLQNIIFEHGISTAEEIDLAAGRGIGLDIVKEKVLSRKGEIKINSKEGEFLAFEITVPLSS
jgi:ligand-binding sensor domain-containing protein/signal transduction histidine kinase